MTDKEILKNIPTIIDKKYNQYLYLKQDVEKALKEQRNEFVEDLEHIDMAKDYPATLKIKIDQLTSKYSNLQKEDKI